MAYSFEETEKLGLKTYSLIFKAYIKIFQRLGLQAVPVSAATGAMGGNHSHEFHVLSQQSGESTIYYQEAFLNALHDPNFIDADLSKYYANEEEKHTLTEEQSKKMGIKSSKSIEIGHLFHLGDKYTRALSCSYQNKEGHLVYPAHGVLWYWFIEAHCCNH